MSALGQKQICAAHYAMSALPPISTEKANTECGIDQALCGALNAPNLSDLIIDCAAKLGVKENVAQTAHKNCKLPPNISAVAAQRFMQLPAG